MNTSSTESPVNHRNAEGRPPKRLLFDRRYGWIFDEWKNPSEEALAGGRGMFCVLPIAKSLVKLASLTINFATDSVNKLGTNPNPFSPQAPHADQCTCLHEIKQS